MTQITIDIPQYMLDDLDVYVKREEFKSESEAFVYILCWWFEFEKEMFEISRHVRCVEIEDDENE